MGKKSSAPAAPPPIDPNQAMGAFLFGSDWDAGAGITDPIFQQRLIDAEREFGPQYVGGELARQEAAAFGIGGQGGFLDLFERAAPRLQQLSQEQTRSQREQDIADIRDLGPEAVQAIRQADPDRARVIEQQQGVTDDLYARAEGVTPQQARMAEQGAREAYAARGRGMDDASVFAEAMGREDIMRQNRMEAQQSGGNLYQMLSASGADPMLAVTGRPSGALPYTFQGLGQSMALGGRGATPQVFAPDTGLNLALAQRAQDMEYDANIYGAQQARSGSIMGGLFEGLGAIGGGMMAAASDRRLKTDLNRIGTHPSGVGIYQFRYLGSPTEHVGVIAQEVREVNPGAVVTMPNGYLGVNYSQI